MCREPVAGEFDHAFKGARLWKQMRRLGHDFERLRAMQLRESLFVQLDHDVIEAANDQQRWRGDPRQCLTCKVRPSAARHHGANVTPKLCCGDQGRRRAGAGAEQAYRGADKVGLPLDPVHCFDKTGREQGNIEHIGAIALFIRGQQVEQ